MSIGITLCHVDTAVPLAVPDKIDQLTQFLDFIELGAINHLAVSVTYQALDDLFPLDEGFLAL